MTLKITSLLAMTFLIAAGPLSFAGKTTPKEAKAVEVKVTAKGFEPSEIKAEAGKPLTLKVTRTTDSTCAKELVFPDLKQTLKLEEIGKEYAMTVTPKEKGQIKFGCGMSQMVGGVVTVE